MYDTIFDYLNNRTFKDGYHTIILKNDTVIDIEVINYYESTIWENTNNIGDSTPDERMLILVFHQSLLIPEDSILTPVTRKKGMVIFCKGVITNKGKISMTARGAIAVGQDVYLYKTVNNEYYVPAVGGLGGSGRSASVKSHAFSSKSVNGLPGSNSSTGGGGSGGVTAQVDDNKRSTAKSGNGSSGTSYSGGSGSGGCCVRAGYGTSYWSYSTGNAGDNGGSGSNAYCRSQHVSNDRHAGGGSGNGPGIGRRSVNKNVYTYSTANGGNGTGGLLIIYCQRLDNQNIIEANGVNASQKSTYAGGGASGGGAIRIFLIDINDLTSDNIQVSGGLGGPGLGSGGNGGDGSVLIEQLSEIRQHVNLNKFMGTRNDILPENMDISVNNISNKIVYKSQLVINEQSDRLKLSNFIRTRSFANYENKK